MDSFGCMNDKADFDDSNDFNDMSNYAAPKDPFATMLGSISKTTHVHARRTRHLVDC
jgi:hypothetical protein